MNKIRMGTVYPGHVGNYEELDWVDLDEMNPLDLVDMIQGMVEELRENGEGELVIVPYEEKKKDANKNIG